MPVQSLDLTLDPDGDAAIRTGWAMFDEIGIRSEGQRTSTSHRPHITTVSLPEMRTSLLQRASSEFGPLLPLRLPVGATVVFGNGPYVVAHLIVASPSLCRAVAEVRNLVETPGLPWIPHLTLARKVPAAQLADAVAAAAQTRPDFVVADHLRHWDPACRTVTTLV